MSVESLASGQKTNPDRSTFDLRTDPTETGPLEGFARKLMMAVVALGLALVAFSLLGLLGPLDAGWGGHAS